MRERMVRDVCSMSSSSLEDFGGIEEEDEGGVDAPRRDGAGQQLQQQQQQQHPPPNKAFLGRLRHMLSSTRLATN